MYATLSDGKVINVREIIQNRLDMGFKMYCYSAHNVEDSFFTEEQYEVLTILDKLIVIVKVNSFTYTDKVKIKIDRLGLKNPELKVAEKGVYIFFIHPCKENHDVVNNEELCAILQISLGYNILHEYIFDNYYYPNSSGSITTTPIDLSKYKFHHKITKNEIDLITFLNGQIMKIDELTRNRLETSLRWYNKATFEEDYVDAFLSYWIALETLAKEQGTDIKYITEHLNKVYSPKEMKEYKNFQVNLLFSIRSAIVHNGKNKKLSFDLLTYTNAIYVDVLFSILDIKTEKRALNFKLTNNIDVSDYTVKQGWKSLDHL